MDIFKHFKQKPKAPPVQLTQEQMDVITGNKVYLAIFAVLKADPFKIDDNIFNPRGYLYGIMMWLKVMAETCNLDEKEMMTGISRALKEHDPYKAGHMKPRSTGNATADPQKSGKDKPTGNTPKPRIRAAKSADKPKRRVKSVTKQGNDKADPATTKRGGLGTRNTRGTGAGG